MWGEGGTCRATISRETAFPFNLSVPKVSDCPLQWVIGRDIIRMDLKESGSEDVDSIFQVVALLSMTKNIQVA